MIPMIEGISGLFGLGLYKACEILGQVHAIYRGYSEGWKKMFFGGMGD
jgi:hypothetical protein